jgi:hypothetical protein
MATASGQYGKVAIASSNIVEVMKWTLELSVPDHPHGTSATSGYKKRTAGTKDGTGSIEGLQDPADPVTTYIEPGDSVTLLLYESAAKFWTVPALITKLAMDVDIDDGAPVSWNSDFGIHGAWTKPTSY